MSSATLQGDNHGNAVANTVPNSTRFARVETPPVRTLGSAVRSHAVAFPSGVGSFAGGEHEVTNLSNHCQPVRLIIV